jgi:hypothetical protein
MKANYININAYQAHEQPAAPAPMMQIRFFFFSSFVIPIQLKKNLFEMFFDMLKNEWKIRLCNKAQLMQSCFKL